MSKKPRATPLLARIILWASLLAMVALQLPLTPPTARLGRQLMPPAGVSVLRMQSLGEPVLTAHFLLLYLQAFDNQPGVSLPFASLSYTAVTAWLSRALALDPAGQYPLMLASQMYAQVPDVKKKREMLAFTYDNFFASPNTRWRWLAHASIIAKHQLHDLPLALAYANAIATHATGPNVPHWAQQLPIFILEDMGEIESAKIMLGALLANGTIHDPREIRFLSARLQQMQKN